MVSYAALMLLPTSACLWWCFAFFLQFFYARCTLQLLSRVPGLVCGGTVREIE